MFDRFEVIAKIASKKVFGRKKRKWKKNFQIGALLYSCSAYRAAYMPHRPKKGRPIFGIGALL